MDAQRYSMDQDHVIEGGSTISYLGTGAAGAGLSLAC